MKFSSEFALFFVLITLPFSFSNCERSHGVLIFSLLGGRLRRFAGHGYSQLLRSFHPLCLLRGLRALVLLQIPLTRTIRPTALVRFVVPRTAILMCIGQACEAGASCSGGASGLVPGNTRSVQVLQALGVAVPGGSGDGGSITGASIFIKKSKKSEVSVLSGNLRSSGIAGAALIVQVPQTFHVLAAGSSREGGDPPGAAVFMQVGQAQQITAPSGGIARGDIPGAAVVVQVLQTIQGMLGFVALVRVLDGLGAGLRRPRTAVLVRVPQYI